MSHQAQLWISDILALAGCIALATAGTFLAWVLTFPQQ